MGLDKKPLRQQKLDDDWEDTVPAEVQSAADEYVGALRKKTAATEKFNGAKTALIDVMKRTGTDKVKVTYKDGEKILELEEIERLHLRKPESAPVEDDGDKE